jgi:hypothetical protein
MLPAKMGMQGHIVKVAVWENWNHCTQPTNGSAIRLLRKSGAVEHARFLFGKWRSPLAIWRVVNEAGQDPVTHWHE